jgi:hypothetical protein
MTDNAAAPAPVTEEVTPIETPEVEQTEDDILDEVWDKANAPDEEITDDPVELKEPEKEPEKAEPVKEEAVEPPKELPSAIRDEWAGMTETARDAVTAFYREQNNKLADQGRKIQAIDPIYQSVIQARENIPGFDKKTPAQIGQDVMQLAQFQANFSKDPINQALTFLQNTGLTDAVRSALGGADQSTAQLHAEIAGLRKELSQRNDPSSQYEMYRQFSQQEQTEQSIVQFAQEAEHWAEVEPILPRFVEAAQAALGEGASNSDVLKLSYDMAVQAKGLPAKVKDAAPASPQPDPAKAEQVEKATSVNLTSQPTGNPRTLSEDEEMDAVWHRMVNS